MISEKLFRLKLEAARKEAEERERANSKWTLAQERADMARHLDGMFRFNGPAQNDMRRLG